MVFWMSSWPSEDAKKKTLTVLSIDNHNAKKGRTSTKMNEVVSEVISQSIIMYNNYRFFTLM